MFYRLDENKNVIPCSVGLLNERERHVRNTYIKKYKAAISTIFLGIDHGYQLWTMPKIDYQPLIFETMIFWTTNQELDLYQERYYTWKEALEGHRRAVREVIAAIRSN